MAGRVRVNTAYIDIRLGSFAEFQAEADKLAARTASQVARRMTDDIAKKVSGKGAGEKLVDDVTKTVSTSAPRKFGIFKTVLSKVMGEAGVDAASRFNESMVVGINRFHMGDLKGFISEMALGGRAAAQAVGSAFRTLGPTIGNIGVNIGKVFGAAVAGSVSLIGSAFARIPAIISGASAAFTNFARQIGLAGFMVQNLGFTLSAALTFPMVGITALVAGFGIAAGVALESSAAALAPFVGGLKNAQAEVKILSDLAAKSPAFNTAVVIEYAKRLQGAGLSMQKTIALMGAISNIATTMNLNVSQTEGVFLAISQVMNKGKLQGQELTQQLAQYLPAAKLVAEGMGITTAKLDELMASGKVSADQFIDAMIKVGNSRRFIEGAATSSDTLKAKFDQLVETVKTKLGNAFIKVFPQIKSAIDKIGPVFDEMITGSDGAIKILGDAFTKLGDFIVKLKEKWDSLTPEQKENITNLILLAVAAGPVILALSALGAVVAGVSAAVGFLISPVGLAIAGIIAIGAAIVTFKDDIKKFFEENKTAHTVLENFKNLANEMTEIFKSKMKPALDDIKAGWKNISDAFGDTGIKGGHLKTVLKVLAAILGTVLVSVIAVAAGVARFVAGLFKAIGSLIGGVIKIITGIFYVFKAAFTGNFEDLKKGAILIWDGLWMAIVGTLWDFIIAIWDGVKTFVDVMVGFFEWLYDVLVGHSIIPDLVNAIIDWFINLKDSVVGFVMDLVNKVVEWFNDLKAKLILTIAKIVVAAIEVWSTIKEKFGEVVRAVGEKISDLISKVTEIRGKVKSAIGNFIDTLKDAGRDLIQGLINGIAEKTGALLEKARGIANAVKNTVKDALDIGSPSRVMMDIGRDTVAGFEIGLDDVSGVTQRAESMALAAIPNVGRTTPATYSPDNFEGSGLAGPTVEQINVYVPETVTNPADIATYTARRIASGLANRTTPTPALV